MRVIAPTFPAPTRISPGRLSHRLLAQGDAGHTQADAAKYFNVSESAISQRVRTLQIATSKVVALERAAEVVDQQLGLQLNISRTLIDLKVVREFQQSVVEVISEESPEVARRVVARLKERRALRASGTLPALDGGFDVA